MDQICEKQLDVRIVGRVIAEQKTVPFNVSCDTKCVFSLPLGFLISCGRGVLSACSCGILLSASCSLVQNFVNMKFYFRSVRKSSSIMSRAISTVGNDETKSSTQNERTVRDTTSSCSRSRAHCCMAKFAQDEDETQPNK